MSGLVSVRRACLLALVAAFAVAVPSSALAAVGGFERVASYRVDKGQIEIVDALPDGRTLVSTQGGGVAFTDIADPARPRDLGAVPLPGSVTTVAVAPDGTYALAGVQTSDTGSDQIALIDVEERRVAGTAPLAEGVDSVAISSDGAYAVVAIENEEDPATPGRVQILEVVGDDPAAWPVRDVTIPTDVGFDAPLDAQPEYVAINQHNKAAVSLQEQNGVMVIDLPTGAIDHIWSAGSTNRLADVTDNDAFAFDEPYSAPRNPDALAWTPDGNYIAEADEGEANFTGGRGFTIREPDGDVVFESGLELELLAAEHGTYPDGRSENRAIEVHGMGVARYDGVDYAFAAAERGDFLAIYDIDDPTDPKFVQLLPTGGEPESVLTIPQRDLVVTSEETSGSISVYRGIAQPIRRPSAPDVVSDGIHFTSLSGLAALPDGNLAAVSSRKGGPPRIYTIDPTAPVGSPTMTGALQVTGITAAPDLTDVAVDPTGGYWLTNNKGSNARLIHTSAAGVVDQQIPLPASATLPTGFGNELSGIATSRDGSRVYFTTSTGGVGELDRATGTFRTFTVPRTANRQLTDISVTPQGELAIIEAPLSNDGTDRVLSRVTIDGLAPGARTAIKATVRRIPADAEYESSGNMAGLAITAHGDVWTVRNNDGHSDHELRNRGRLFDPAAVPQSPLGLPSATNDAAGVVTDGPVWSLATDGERVFVGGDFSMIGRRGRLASIVDPDTGLPGPKHPSFTSSDVVPDGAGGFYASGSFTTVDGVPQLRVVHLLPDRTVDPAFKPNVANGTVASLQLVGNRLYIGGSFTTVDGQERSRMAALDAVTGALVPEFNPQVTGTTVTELELDGTTLYAIGTLTAVGGQPRTNAAAFDLSTPAGALAAWAPQITGTPSDVAIGGTRAYLAGSITNVGGQARAGLAAVNLTDGAVDPVWNVTASGARSVVAHGGRVYAGGSFAQIGGVARNLVAALDPADGSVIQGFDAHALTNGLINELNVANGRLYMAGGFSSVGGHTRAGFAAVDLDTGADTGFRAASSSNGTLIVPGENGVYVATGGGAAIGVATGSAAAFDVVTNEIDTNWRPLPVGDVYAIAVGGSKVYLGGAITRVGSASRSGVVAVGRERGELLDEFDPGVAGGDVNALAFDGERLYAGGDFVAPRSRLAVLDPVTGAVDPAFGAEAFGAGGVETLALAGDRLYAGGNFHTIGGFAQRRLAALDRETGDPIRSFAPMIEDSIVEAVRVDGDDVYAGGTFGGVEGVTRVGLARVDADSGALDTAFAPVLNSSVNTIELTAGHVIVGGFFSQMDGAARTRVGAIDKATGAVDSWAPDIDLTVNALLVHGTTLFTGGGFGRVNNEASNGLAVFRGAAPVNATPPSISGSAVEGSTLTCMPGTWQNGAVSYAYEWRRDGTPIPGAVASTYTTTFADVGASVACAVRASNQTGEGVEAVSAAVVPTPGVPSAIAGPSIAGTPAAGETLTAVPGRWRNDPAGFAYQWLADGAPIPGATGPTYVVSAEDATRSIAVRIVATNAQGDGAPVVSDAVRIAPLQGPAGPQGDPGPAGPGGPQGDPGPVGPGGPQGDPGPIGPRGPAGGPKGDRGPMGPKGDRGPTGPKGDRGSTGPKGDRGSKGDKGDRGYKGDEGPRGRDGHDGRDAEVTCRVERGDRITCRVEYERTSRAARAKLTRKGRVYARGTTGRLTATRALPRGRYVLTIGRGEKAARLTVNIAAAKRG